MLQMWAITYATIHHLDLAVLFEKSSGGLRKPPKALNATRNTQHQAAAMSEKRNGRPGVQW